MLKKLFSDRNLLILAFVFAAVVLFVRLGAGGIPAAQEGRTAIIVRNMILSGNYLDMNVDHGIPYEKPIGHYWLCLPFALILGAGGSEPAEALSEWAFRLPSALSGILVLAAVALLARRIYGPKTAALSVFALATMAEFTHLGRLAHIDMPLCAAFTWAMVFLYIGYFERMRSSRWIYGFYALLGWGMVLKGPLVVILAGLVVLAMMLRTRRWRMILELRPFTGGLVFLAAALPWYIVETIRTNGAFYEEFIVNQNIRRFTGIGSTYRGGRHMPMYYYIPKMLAGLLPWSIVPLIAGIAYWKRIVKLRLKTPSLFLFFWFATGFVFFSLSALKRGDYILPLYPPLAVMTAAAVVGALPKLPHLTRRWLWGWIAAAVLGIGFLALSFSGILIKIAEMGLRKEIIHLAKSDAKNIIMISGFVNGHALAAGAGVVLALGIVFAFGMLLERGRWREALYAFCGLVFCGFVVFYSVIDPATARFRTVKPFTEEARKIIPPGTEYVEFYDFNTELLFFLNRPYDTRVKPETRYVVTSREGLSEGKFVLDGPNPEWKLRLKTDDRHLYWTCLLERIVK